MIENKDNNKDIPLKSMITTEMSTVVLTPEAESLLVTKDIHSQNVIDTADVMLAKSID